MALLHVRVHRQRCCQAERPCGVLFVRTDIGGNVTPIETMAVALVKLVAEMSPDVFPVAEVFHYTSLERPDWDEIDRKKVYLSGGERALIELAWDTWLQGTGSLAAVMARCDADTRAQVIDLILGAHEAMA